MPLESGTRLGPYEILAPIGAGGMGEVYRARDTRLGREVAVKILPSHLASDPVRRGRFEQEARAVAALNHPNILAVHDVGSDREIYWMVSELVDGEPLRGGALSVRRKIHLAVQIADALAAAHAANVIHRDLKPDNILVTRDGRIKILDFGLAKLGPSGISENQITETQTQAGTIVGTVAYMSPEQVRGQPVDHRSDLFSFGIVLHELLGGQPVFRGPTAVETMTAILNAEAPELPDSIPAEARRIVEHCLEKDPDRRFQSARDLAFALGGTTGAGNQREPPRVGRRLWWTLIPLGLGLLLLGMGSRLLWTPAPERQTWSGGRLSGPKIAFSPAPSPDGHLLALTVTVDALTQVAVMKPESGNWSVLTHRRDRGMVTHVCWSPDGSLVYFSRIIDVPKGVYSIPVLGGEEHLLLEDADMPEALPDGTLLLYRLNAQRQWQLFRFWPETGKLQDFPIVLRGPFDLASLTHVLPDGKHALTAGISLAGNSQQAGFFEIELSSGTVQPVAAGGYQPNNIRTWTVSQDGQSIVVVTAAEGLLRFVSVPLGRRAPPQILFTTTSDAWNIASGPERSLYVAVVDRPAELVRLSLSGARPETIANFAQVPDIDMVVALPDGRLVIPEQVAGRVRLVAVELGKAPSPLVNTADETAAPMAALGSRELAFVFGPAPREAIAVADTTSGRITQRFSPGKGTVTSLAGSVDGRTIYFAAGGGVWSMPASGGAPRNITTGDAVITDPARGDLVVARVESARIRLYRVPANGGAEQEIPIDSGAPLNNLFFSPGSVSRDGRMLLSLLPADTWFNPPAVLDMATGKVTRIVSDKESDYHSAAWMPDGSVVGIQLGLRASIWKFHPERETR